MQTEKQEKDLPDVFIDRIAGALNSDMVCFINPETLEMEDIPQDALLGIYYDETGQEVLERIEHWKNVITVDHPEYEDMAESMRSFVDHYIPQGNLKVQLNEALSLRRPDKYFDKVLDNSEYRDKWTTYNRQQLTQYVRRKLKKAPTLKKVLE